MAFSMRSFRYLHHAVLLLILLVTFAAFSGCGNDQSSDGSSDWVVLPSGGQHAKSSVRDYIPESESIRCMECHGADLSGGTSQVSCFENPAGCHHGPVPGWIATSPAAQNHGVSAKKVPGSSGFVSCQICHANDFSGGGSQVTCLSASCHGGPGQSPHPANWLSADTYMHTSTAVENASVCAQCHTAGENSPIEPPSPPAPAGTAPGCFNSTLCHGDTAAPHAVGTAWLDPNPQFHGLTAKQDLSYCQGCHGTPGTTLFNGGIASTSCQTSTCHPLAKAHPTDWIQAPQPFPFYESSHRDSGNRSVACAICHKTDGPGTGPDPDAPSCSSVSFDGNTCHSGSLAGVNHPVSYPETTHTSLDQ